MFLEIWFKMEDQEIEIINSSTRRDKILNILKNNFKILITLLFLSVIILLSIFFYKDLKNKNKIEISEKFNKSIMNFDQINKNNLVEIILEKDKTYSPLALYYIIENNLIDSNEEINKYFDIIINDLDLEKNIKLLNIYKKAIFNSNFENEENMIKLINPLITDANPWKSHALYLMAEYYYSKNQKIKAKEFYNNIIILNSSNANLKLEAQKRLQRDLSD